MTALAPTLESFFTTRLISQSAASPNTIAAYRDTWRLLLGYLSTATATAPQDLDLGQLDKGTISEFLDWLETSRSNTVATRNCRLAAVRSFFGYAAYQHPEHAALIQAVLAIPAKRRPQRTDVTWLGPAETDALLAAPNPATATGRRDRALIQVGVTTGMRASELTGLLTSDIHLGTGAHARCHGKGRKDRTTPLDRATVAVLRNYLQTRARTPTDYLFPTRTGTRMSTDALAARIALHSAAAALACPSMRGKHVTPHVLRHTAAMRLLNAGIDTSMIALWLGHESMETTGVYLHADIDAKQRTLDRLRPPGTAPGRYQAPDDALLKFLQAL